MNDHGCVKTNFLGTKWECLECSAIVRNPRRHHEWHGGQRAIVKQLRGQVSPDRPVSPPHNRDEPPPARGALK